MNELSPVLHVGFYNYVLTEHVVMLLDYKTSAAKKLVKSARVDKPRSVIDITRGKKAVTLIVLTSDRYVISAIHRKQLARRLGAFTEPDPIEILTPPRGSPRTLRGAKKNVKTSDVGDQTEGTGTVPSD